MRQAPFLLTSRKMALPLRRLRPNTKGKADAEAKLYTHLTTAPMVKIDGVEEEHTKVKSKDEAAVRNLARYILSR